MFRKFCSCLVVLLLAHGASVSAEQSDVDSVDTALDGVLDVGAETEIETEAGLESFVFYLDQGEPGEPGKDIWTTSVFSYAPGGGGPGGGLDNEALVTGGWGDRYYSLLEFDLTGLPVDVESVILELYCFQSRSGTTTGLYLDRITELWDWRIQGTGSDMERLWWADRPAAEQWIPSLLPAPAVGEWYSVDITDLYRGWMDGTYPNFGLQLRPGPNPGNNTWSEFYSSDYADDPTLRPRLVIEPAEGFRLSFPMREKNPFTHPVSAFMDHHVETGFNVQDGRVLAFDGSLGTVESGCRYYLAGNFGDCDPENYTDFVVTGFLQEEGGARFLDTLAYDGGFGGIYGFYDGHTGYDYPGINGQTEVIAAAEGTVVDLVSGDDPVANRLEIQHGETGFRTFYLHLTADSSIGLGSEVSRGQLLGVVGLGHLHFTVHKDGQRVDPYGWIGPGDEPLTDAGYLWDVPFGLLFADGFESGDLESGGWNSNP